MKDQCFDQVLSPLPKSDVEEGQSFMPPVRHEGPALVTERLVHTKTFQTDERLSFREFLSSLCPFVSKQIVKYTTVSCKVAVK